MTKEELVREAVRRFRTGDEDGMLALFHPEIEVWATDETLNSGSYKGREGARQWYSQWHDAWDEIDYEPLEFIEVSETMVVVPVLVKASARGAEVSQELTWMFEIENDLCTRWELHNDREAALASARVWLAASERS